MGPPSFALALKHEVVNSILLPALLVILRAEGLFLAVADRLDAICGYALLQESLLYRFRTAGSQGEIEFLGSPVVTMPFNQHFYVRMLLKERSVLLRRGYITRADVGLVVVEEHIFNVLTEQIFVRR